jgi:hypothetical protein
MTKCDNCSVSATYVLDTSWGLPQYFCEDCLPRAVRAQFGPEHLKELTLEVPEEAVAETVVEEPLVEEVVEAVAEEVPAPSSRKKKNTVAAEEPAEDSAPVDAEEQVAANVSDN